MSLGDIVARTDLILHKYEKYTAKHEERPERPKGADKFTDEYVYILQRIEEVARRAEEVSGEANRAVKAALNAELRRAKTAIVEGNLANLEKLVRKGKPAPDVLEDRLSKVDQVKASIDAIPDGVHGTGRSSPVKRTVGTVGQHTGKGADGFIHIELHGRGENYFTPTTESSKFRQDFEIAKVRQDRQLDGIERGLGTLQQIGEAMGQALDHQDVLTDAIVEKVDDMTKRLKTNNMKLKGLVTQMRSTRNFCLDVILISVLLAIGLFIFNMFHTL